MLAFQVDVHCKNLVFDEDPHNVSSCAIKCHNITRSLVLIQVGSKNAAFYMGQSVKVVTKKADSPYVHELGLVAAELEQRYKDSKVSLGPLLNRWLFTKSKRSCASDA